MFLRLKPSRLFSPVIIALIFLLIPSLLTAQIQITKVPDLNGDGISDLIWHNPANGQSVAWLMNGINLTNTAALPSDPSWKIAAAADFNGDGMIDLVWSNASNGQVIEWLMNGTSILSSTLLLEDPLWKVTDAADLNGDGMADLLLHNSSTGQTVAWIMNGTSVTSWSLLLTDPNLKIVAVADFNGDGISDLLWNNATTGQTALWLMNGTTQSSASTLVTDPNWKITATADFNLDKKADILWYNTATGETALWLMNGITATDRVTLQSDLNWKIAAIGDLNGDGRADLLWNNATTGQTAAWLMNGTSVVSNATLLTDLNWKIIAAADFNADKKSDLLWYNAGTGQTSLWLMDGTTGTKGTNLFTDPQWRLQCIKTSSLTSALACDDAVLNASVGNIPVPPNQPPVVNAGMDQTITLPAVANLSGTFTDDGIPIGLVTSVWSQVGGPAAVVFGNATSLNTTATFSAAGTYTLRLLATDSQLSASNDVVIVVSDSSTSRKRNQPPVVDAGPDQAITLPATANLLGSATDDGLPNKTLTALWSKVNGPGSVTFSNAKATATSAAFSSAGTYTLRLTANDGALYRSDDIVVVVDAPSATNHAPVVNAGPDQMITLPAAASLAGTATDDGLPTGSTLTRSWSKVAGTGAVTFSDASSPNPIATFSAPGTYTLRLTASDGKATTSDDMIVVVSASTAANKAPVVNAGPDQTVTIPGGPLLSGTATDDGLPTGSTISVSWTKISGPGTVVFVNANSLNASAVMSTAGTYTLRLTASDGALPSSDDVIITVNPAAQTDTMATLNAAVATGQAHYVDNSASARCSNSPSYGSQSNPWCTITYGIGQLNGGETLYVKAGTYNELIYINRPAGTAASPTVIRSYPGQTVNIVGPGVNSGRVKIVDTSYVTLDGFDISNFNQGVFVENSNHIVVRNNIVHHVGQEGIHVHMDSSFITLESNTVHDTRQWMYNGEGIYVGTGSGGPPDNTNNVTIRSNLIYNTNDEGIELKPGTHDSLIEGNVLYNIMLDPAYSAGAGAIEIGEATISCPTCVNGLQTWAQNPNFVVRNNIVHTSKTGIRAGTGSLVYNNLVYDIPTPFYGILADNNAGDSYTRRIYHNTVDLPSSRAIVVSSATSDVRNNIGPSTANNIATAATFYVNPAGANYHLVSGSAPINAGLDLTATVPMDIEGISRSSYSAPDLGAYEFAGLSTPTNLAPVVNAGPDFTITLPNGITLAGSATDDGLPTGSTLTKSWSKVSGPGTVTFGNAAALNSTTSFSVAGTYTLRLTVSDGLLSTSDDVVFTVNAAPVNKAPVVNAGADFTITLPNGITLAGSATDDGLPSGSTLTKSWSKVSGPGTVTFGNAAALNSTASFSVAGTYTLRLTVSDSLLSASDDVVFTVNAAPATNLAPVVNAGSDSTTTLPNGVTLAGTATDDGLPTGSTLTRSWSKVSGPGTVTFGNAAALNSTASFSVSGTYTLRLTASDSLMSSSDDVTIVVNAAVATGQAHYVDNSASAACSNSPSYGSQSNPWCTITYGIGQLNGGETLYVKAGTYNELIYINRPAGTAASPTVIRTYPGQAVNIVGPGVNSGRVKIDSTSYITFDGFDISNFNQGLFVENSNHIVVKNNIVHHVGQEGIHVHMDSSFVTLESNTVHDTRQWMYNGEGIYVGGSSTGPLDNSNNITIRNNLIYNTIDEGIELKPGTHDSLIEGNVLYNIMLDPAYSAGAGAIEINEATISCPTCVNGLQTWAQNPNFIVRNNIVHTSKTGIRAGTGSLVYNNLVYDIPTPFYGILADNNAGDSYTRRIYHNTVDLPSSRAIVVTSATSDVRNNIGPSTTNNIATAATFYVNPAGANYHLVSGSAPINAGLDLTATVPTDIEGISRSSYSAPDLGAYEYAGVSAPTNRAPIVNAGPDFTITLPNGITLAGSATDDGLPTGSTLTRSWSKVSGPGTVTFGNAAALNSTASFSAAGTYTLRLTVSDGLLSASDDVVFTVNAAPATNLAPVVNAGPDFTITLPNGITLAGSATDDGLPTGSALTKSWSKVSGPGTVTFGNAAALNSTASFSTAGTYTLRLTASDSALSSSDDIVITVIPANQAPVVNAGPDFTITLPNGITLAGSATDDGLPSGSTLTKSWSKVSGPGTVTFGNAAALNSTASFSVAGTYTLRLTVSDSLLSASDDVVFTVNAAPATNLAPVVNAGPDSTTTLPNGVTLAGSATDDGLPTGSTLTKSWSKVSGPGTVTFGNAAALNSTASFSVSGTYTLRLTASDSLMSSSDDVTIVVNAAVATGQAHYVDNSASAACSNSPSYGSQSNPWCTITYGIGQLNGGETLYVKAGTYNELIYINRPAGTAASPTVIRTYPGQAVNIVGPGVNSGRVKIDSTSYITFDGFDISNFNQGLFVENSNHIVVKNNIVHHVGQEGIHVHMDSSFVTLESNTVHDTRQWMYNGEGIYVGGSSTGPLDNSNNITIRNNLIYNTIDEGIELKPGTHDSLIEGNVLYNIMLDPAYSAGAGAIEINEATISCPTCVNGLQTWAQNPNFIVRNNIVHTSKTGIRAGTGSLVYNNLVYDIPTPFYGILADNNAGDSYTRRIYHNTVDLPSSRAIVVTSATSDVRNNIGPSTTNNIATAATFYVNPAGANYHLVSGSAPINAGLDLTATVPTDIEGISRSSYSAPDLGAYEYAGVSAPTNHAPIVNAGPDFTITLPNGITLAGSATDDGLPTGSTLTRSWSKVSGPGTVTFGNAAALNSTASFSAAGTYTLRLTVSDGLLSASDDVVFTVNAAPATNLAPVVNAGPDQTITFPAAATLTGTATDDGLPSGTLTKTWTKVSGPGTVVFVNANALNASATFSVAGSYILRLTVTDGALMSSDDVTVTVNSCGTVVSGTKTVVANATDNVGVSSVQMKLDGVSLGPNITSAPYSIPWNTTTASNGCHVLSVIAQDAAGNQGTASVSILVSNP